MSEHKWFRRVFMKFARSPYANFVTSWAVTKRLHEISATWECQECNATFPSKQSLALHRYTVHQVRNPVRAYIEGPTCPVCLKFFHTRERCIRHVAQASDTCRANLLIRGDKLPDNTVAQLDAQARPEHRSLYLQGASRVRAGQAVCLQAQGPKWPILCP